VRDNQGWRLERRLERAPTARLRMDADAFWRLTTGGLDPAETQSRIHRDGDPELTRAASTLVSVIR
jgi:hypothetical protein